MDSTLIYELALFLHIVGALGLVATMTIEWFALHAVRPAANAGKPAATERAMRFVPPMGAGSAALILSSGLYMMATSWGVRGWIVVGIAGLVVNALAGAIVTRRYQHVGFAFVLASLRMRLGTVLGVVLIMTVKPSLVFSAALLVIAALVGLLTSQVSGRRNHGELQAQNG